MLPHSSWAVLFIFFFRGTAIKSSDKARTVLCRSRYLRYLSPFFTLRAALLFFTLISLHQNAKNRKKKKKERERKRKATQARVVCRHQPSIGGCWGQRGAAKGNGGCAPTGAARDAGARLMAQCTLCLAGMCSVHHPCLFPCY